MIEVTDFNIPTSLSSGEYTILVKTSNKTIKEASKSVYILNSEDLQISAKFDKEAYFSGENAKVELTLKKANGDQNLFGTMVSYSLDGKPIEKDKQLKSLGPLEI
jgi:uncharacterized protein YfaS (alpha-2-macroglobulin family)